MSWSGANMRCPRCNHYLPDRCTCNGPPIEETLMTNQETINETLAVPESALNTGDWPEDAAHENGNYQCQCSGCGRTFIGHKRRVVCKECADEPRRTAANPNLAAPYGTGRLTNSEPVEYVTTKHGVERRRRGLTIDTEAIPGAVLVSGAWPGGDAVTIGMDFGDVELRTTALNPNLAAPYGQPPSTSPAGSNAGQFQLHFPDDGRSIRTCPVSGNARQRRRQVRRWKAKGFTVKQFNPATRTTIER